ncbi:MAG: NAD(P)H-hydrate dehydratase [Flavitalea sp.]
MQIFSREQIRAWDEYTITNEPVSKLDLMERAAKACYDWLMGNDFKNRSFTFFCAKGNNGGDGLALARMLAQSDYTVKVFILEFGTLGTDEFQFNLVQLHHEKVAIKFISTEETLSTIDKNDIVIDALLGSGINRPIEGLTAVVIEHINQSGNQVISIDIPSGLYPERSSKNNTIIRATHTLSFQCYKLAFMMAENEIFIGQVHVLDIGLHLDFPSTISSSLKIIDSNFVVPLLKKRRKFSHKGDFGHVALLAGSKGMMGAAVLCARAIIRSGAGKLTCHVVSSGINIMQTSVPEAMCKEEEGDDFIKSIGDLEKYQAIAIGPGIGKQETHAALITKVFQSNKPMVIDADALNTIAANPELLLKINRGAIVTPHPGEFARLFGKTENDFDNIQLALNKSKELDIYIVLKGAYTFIATPDGSGFFNTSGNPGMAKGGSGDVLTGIIVGLLAQKYEPLHAAALGVYLHGCAGDFAALRFSQSSMNATDITDHLGDAFNSVSEFNYFTG